MFTDVVYSALFAVDTGAAWEGIIASGPVAAVLATALYVVVRWGREKDNKAEEAMKRALNVKVDEARDYADKLQEIKDAQIAEMKEYKDSCQAVIKQKEKEIANLHKENKQLYEKTWTTFQMIAEGSGDDEE